MGLRWRGEEVKRRIQMASIAGVNVTMGQAIEESKTNHPWTYRTGTLERGIKIVQSAAVRGRSVFGLWGVANVLYGKFLEANPKWAWLHPAASQVYPRLTENIKAALGNG